MTINIEAIKAMEARNKPSRDAMRLANCVITVWVHDCKDLKRIITVKDGDSCVMCQAREDGSFVGSHCGGLF